MMNENNVYPTDSHWQGIKKFLKDKFNLDDDKASQEDVVANISKGVDFYGTNLWVLIFATFVASIGLNVNSAAVIIGAMLISPLMGPIMGIGLSVGINDFMLFKRSLKNFGFMVLIAIITATLYFLISPLSTAQSELLARTTPTTWDVLIAFFGGLAGIVAQTRKDRTSTVIPGVAIATALMPPLCTAGFGLATGQFTYFFGAAFLFFINTVFIAVATYIIVRYLKYTPKVFVDKVRERKVKRYMTWIIAATITLSVFLSYRIVQQTIFDANADKFVSEVMVFEKSQVLDYSKHYNSSGSTITVAIIGNEIPDDVIVNLRKLMPSYGLKNVELIVRQSNREGVASMSVFQTNIEQIISDRDKQIVQLKKQLSAFAVDTVSATDISREMSALVGKDIEIAISKATLFDSIGAAQDTVLMCLIENKTEKPISANERARIEGWLKARTKVNNVKLFVQ